MRIAEHRVRGSVDDCYLLTREATESGEGRIEFEGDLDFATGAFRGMTCSILPADAPGSVRVGSLEFQALTEETTLLDVYETRPSDEAEEGSGGPGDASDARSDLVRAVVTAVLDALRRSDLLL